MNECHAVGFTAGVQRGEFSRRLQIGQRGHIHRRIVAEPSGASVVDRHEDAGQPALHIVGAAHARVINRRARQGCGAIVKTGEILPQRLCVLDRLAEAES